MTFNNSAEKSFQFPIRNSIRISFWPNNATFSSPSEITFGDDEIYKNKQVNADIIILDWFDIKEGDYFEIGAFSDRIASGKILKIEDDIW